MSRSEGIYNGRRHLNDSKELITSQVIADMILSIPNDGREYYWSINYQQLKDLRVMYDYTEFEVVIENTKAYYFLFGLPVKIDNLPEPISLQPVDIEKVNGTKSIKRVNPVNWKDE